MNEYLYFKYRSFEFFMFLSHNIIAKILVCTVCLHFNVWNKKQELILKILLAYSKPIVVLKLLFSKQYNGIKATYLVVYLLLFSRLVSRAIVEKGLNRIKKNIIRQRNLALAIDNIWIKGWSSWQKYNGLMMKLFNIL